MSKQQEDITINKLGIITLRFITPITLGILSLQFLDFKDELKANTAMLFELKTKVAIIEDRMSRQAGRLDIGSNNFNNVKGEIR